MKRALKHIQGSPRPGDPPELTNLELSRFLVFIETRLTRMVNVGVGAVVVLALTFVAFAGVSVLQRNDKEHDQCMSANKARLAIKGAFNDYTNALGAAAGPDKATQLEAFRADFNKRLEKGLPQRKC